MGEGDRSQNALTTDWRPDQVAVMHGLRDWATSFDGLHRHLAAWMDLPVVDAGALGQVVWADQAGEPLSPVELSRIVGLTSGATTALVDRLEARGHVERTRESTDRRRVTLRPTPAARERTSAFLDAAGAEVQAVLAGADAAELEVVTAFLQRMVGANRAATTRLAERPPGGQGPGQGSASTASLASRSPAPVPPR